MNIITYNQKVHKHNFDNINNIETIILYHKIEEKWDEKKTFDNLNKLPNFYKEKIFKYKKKERRIASIIGKILLINGLKLFQKNNNDLEYKEKGNSKPFIRNAPFFNISHSGDIVVCAISKTYDIGIDIEKIKPINIDTFTKILSKGDLNYIEKSPNPLNTFFEIWTKKEAILKSLGTGIIPTLFKNISLKKNMAILNNKEKWLLKKISLNKKYITHLALPINNGQSNFNQTFLNLLIYHMDLQQ